MKLFACNLPEGYGLPSPEHNPARKIIENYRKILLNYMVINIPTGKLQIPFVFSLFLHDFVILYWEAYNQ